MLGSGAADGDDMALATLRKWLGRQTRPPTMAVEEAIARAEDFAEAMAVVAREPDVPASVWNEDRLAIEEELWGADYLTPGGAAEVLRFAVPLGLSQASSLLLLGAGMGGPALTLANDLGVWTAGFEADPILAALATKRIQRVGGALAKRASVGRWDRQAPAFRANFYHHALMLDAIRDAVPEQVVSSVAEALKPHGQVVLVETVAEEPLAQDDKAVLAWCGLEGRRPVLPMPSAITRVLGRLGYDIRVEEDISARHMKLAVLGWKSVLRAMKGQKPDRARAAAIVHEAEMWTRRIRLMHDGRIRLMRWHAIHRAKLH